MSEKNGISMAEITVEGIDLDISALHASVSLRHILNI